MTKILVIRHLRSIVWAAPVIGVGRQVSRIQVIYFFKSRSLQKLASFKISTADNMTGSHSLTGSGQWKITNAKKAIQLDIGVRKWISFPNNYTDIRKFTESFYASVNEKVSISSVIWFDERIKSLNKGLN